MDAIHFDSGVHNTLRRIASLCRDPRKFQIRDGRKP